MFITTNNAVIDRPLKMFSILSRRLRGANINLRVPEICTNTCQEQLASQIIITVATLHNNHRNLHEFSPRNYVSYNPPPPSFRPSRIYSSILLLRNYPYGRNYRWNGRIVTRAEKSNCNLIPFDRRKRFLRNILFNNLFLNCSDNCFFWS